MSIRPRYVLLSFIPFLLALNAPASVALSDAECARAELIWFSEQLRGLPGVDPAEAEAARASLGSAPDDVVMSLHENFERVEGWRQIPAVAKQFARAVDEQQAAQLRRIVEEATARQATALTPDGQAESRRQILLSVVSFFRGLTPLAGPESDQRWAELQMMIERAQPDVLPAIADALRNGVDKFTRDLVAPASFAPPSGRRLPQQSNVDCSSYCCTRVCDPTGLLGCGDVCIPGCTAACDAIVSAANAAFEGILSGLRTAKAGLESSITALQNQITSLLAQITDLTNQVAGFVNQIGGFVTDAINATTNLINQIGGLVSSIGSTFTNLYNQISTLVTGFIDQLIALVPKTPEEAFALLTGIQVTSAAWVDDLLARFPVLEPPCPAFGTDIGPLGTVGTLAAAQKSDGFAKLTKILYDVAPSDVAGIKIKLAAAAIYHPAEYWNLCARSRYAIAKFDAESAHRDLETGNLNVALSTRGTKLTVDAASAAVLDVDSDVNAAGLKVDSASSKSDELLRRLDKPLSSRTSQVSVNSLRGTVGDLDRDVAKVETKLDILQTKVLEKAKNQRDRQVMLAAFQDLVTRLSIEDNLLESSNTNIISIFQMPEAFGGNLSLVRSVVEKTINAMLAAGQRVNNAQTELGRGDALITVGDFAGAFKQFRKAYGEAVKP